MTWSGDRVNSVRVGWGHGSKVQTRYYLWHKGVALDKLHFPCSGVLVVIEKGWGPASVCCWLASGRASDHWNFARTNFPFIQYAGHCRKNDGVNFVVRVVEWPSSRGRIVDVTNALRLNFADGAIALGAIVIVPFVFFIRTHRYATTCALNIIRLVNDPVPEVHRMLDVSAVPQGHLPHKLGRCLRVSLPRRPVTFSEKRIRRTVGRRSACTENSVRI